MAELIKVRHIDGLDGETEKKQDQDKRNGEDNKGYSDYYDTELPVNAEKGNKSEKSPKSQEKSKKMQTAILSGLQYKVDDNPPWITTFLLGFQHYLMLLSSNLATPGIMASVICAIGIPEENHVKSMLLGNMIFACGICTLIQTFFGARLPIVQCPAYAYIVPMLALTKIGQWKCTAADAANIENGVNTTTMRKIT